MSGPYEVPRPARRVLLAGLAGSALTVAGCGGSTGSGSGGVRSTTKVRYGTDRSQYAVLRQPTGRSRGTIALIHGGFWSAEYTADLMTPISERLTTLGWTTYNLEYRGVGSGPTAGGGYPTTFTDVATGLDKLATLPGVDPRRVVFLGHSAGGHLAAWAASRTAQTPGGKPAVAPAEVISLSGVLDLTHAAETFVGNGAAVQLMGGATPGLLPRLYHACDPTLLVPAPAPVHAVHASDDTVVPRSQSQLYVAADTKAGGTASLELVPGGHFGLIDPSTQAWAAIEKVVAAALPR